MTMMTMELIAVLTASCLMLLVHGHSKVEQADDGSSGKISFSTPDLSDEDSHSPWMPDELKCDACRAIAFQLWKHFKDYNDKRKSLKYKLPESDVLDITETLCSDRDTWEGYGLKEVKKVKRLSGVGLETSDIPGVTAGGGKWPSRLRDMCETYTGELGEMEIYNQYRKEPENLKAFENYLCRGKGIRSNCEKKKKKKKDEL